MEEKKLPNGWKWVKLGETIDIQGGSQPPKSNFVYEPTEGYVQLLQIRDFGERGVPTYVPISMVTKFCNKDDIMVARYGASLGRIITGLDGAYNVALAKVIDNKNIFEKRYIYYVLKTQIFQGPLKLLSRSAQNGFSKSELAHILLPLPSIAVQRAIVSKVEQLFSELDKGIENLRLAQQQLKVYRQSVLKWAFEGRFTNDNVIDAVLPAGWKWTTIGELMESVRNGFSGKPNVTGEFEILRISSVRPNRVYLNDVRFLDEKLSIENSLQENDILFTRYNGSIDFVGVCGRVPKLNRILFYPDKLIRCRPKVNDWDHSAFIDYAANSRLSRQFVLSKLKTTAGQTGISGSDIKEIPIPLPSIEEQRLVVEAIEKRLSIADKLEEDISQNLQKAEALRQSILKKAFEGKLV